MTSAADPVPRTRIRIRVEGIVQGVGFRPFVHELADEHGIAGFVGNDSAGVFAEAEGAPSALERFVADLERRAPPLARVERVVTEPREPRGERGFRIVASVGGAARQALVPPDAATCAACVREVFDPSARRHRYAFTNCTDCGPRFTIVTDVPYDRGNTTMAAFPMCGDCAREYADPRDRRFHAQPVCCPACGPALRLLGPDGRAAAVADPVGTAARWLLRGRVLAVKGLGGYHLAALAGHEEAVAALRARKHREDKPFAVMAPDAAAARALVHLEPEAERLLTGARAPIVLAPRRAGAGVAAAVAPGSRWLGVMLPYTPLHHLLLRRVARPVVLTSGNRSDEPIAHRDDDAVAGLAGIADGFLLHDRPIHVRTDDSVVRVFRGRPYPVRRSRGYAPSPVTVRGRFPRPVLACGAELKNTFCVAKGDRAFLSHHIGDLENYETLRSYVEGIAHFRRVFDVRPEVVAHDLHPEYLSTKYALEQADAEPVGVQHHHAHIASCLADNGVCGPVIGVAFDGLGYGDDGVLWGGELLVADLAGYERAGHLAAVPMPGGAAAVREPWRMAAAYLDALYGGDLPDLDVVRRHRDRWAAVAAMARTGTNAPLTTSAGRLFDAVSAIAGVRDAVTYEGQAAVELEQRVYLGEHGAYRAGLAERPRLVISGHDLVRAAVDDLAAGADAGRVAARFHNGLARAVADAADVLRQRTGLRTVALSGGVFQNLVLLERVVSGLEEAGFAVLVHSRVPPNDGGISLGQAVVAAARDRRAPLNRAP
ncbi:carbamoyltransferase HypF [Actinomadura keratinilytica]|uniref:carbamoyltransferase HypF n=1 Tax=Actinomadura keratinilytica TaxID=547461 RepID=UPI003616CF3B